MAKVHAQIIGGEIKELVLGTVGDVKSKLNASNYTVTVNGEPESDSYQLQDFDFVSLAPAVKGA